MTNSTINPAWKAYNAIDNEGGEGYNPHRKYIATKPATHGSAARSNDPIVQDEMGRYISASKLADRLAKDISRMNRITDPFAREITQRAIDFARAQLGF